ncbi:hypothetical protein L933_06510 [Helicobacter pylori PZ5056]|uniref:Uncharacterized protein n=1 Tax=Helicobacter pylori PZ5056 TaxID=1337393 RepID=T2T145_HELPX|nr:hypothetical protein L933_06510 [Helicobacter pylori PZ5056]
MPPMKTILLFLSYCIALIFKRTILNANNLFNYIRKELQPKSLNA